MANVKPLRSLPRYHRMGLDAKIRYANRMIEAALEMSTTPTVAWSGGKDSTVLLHLIRQFVPDILVNFNNTMVEFPETLRFVRRMEEEWQLDLHISKPERGKDFWWCQEKFGWPLMGKDFMRKIAHPTKRQKKLQNSDVRIASNCCYYLKEKPAILFQRERNIDLVLLGTLACESNRRRINWYKYGDLHWVKKEKVWKAKPLSIWKEEDIWEYHRRFDIPMCELYAMGHRRNGCWVCGMSIAYPNNNLAMLRVTHPKMWHFLMINKGLGEELVKLKLALDDGQYSLFAHTMGVERLIQERPCFFDKV